MYYIIYKPAQNVIYYVNTNQPLKKYDPLYFGKQGNKEHRHTNTTKNGLRNMYLDHSCMYVNNICDAYCKYCIL